MDPQDPEGRTGGAACTRSENQESQSSNHLHCSVHGFTLHPTLALEDYCTNFTLMAGTVPVNN